MILPMQIDLDIHLAQRTVTAPGLNRELHDNLGNQMCCFLVDFFLLFS